MATKPKKNMRWKKEQWRSVNRTLIDTQSEDNVVRAFMVLADWAMTITKGHVIKRGGEVWSIHKQLLHSIEEITEAYRAIRMDKCYDEITHEMVDGVFGTLTNFNIFRLGEARNLTKEKYDAILDNAIRTVVRKLKKRVNQKGYKAE